MSEQVQFQRGTRVRYVEPHGMSSGEVGTVKRFPGDPGYGGRAGDVWVEFDNGTKFWVSVQWLVLV